MASQAGQDAGQVSEAQQDLVDALQDMHEQQEPILGVYSRAPRTSAAEATLRLSSH